MQTNEIRDINGNLIEYTTIETIETTTYYKRYNGQGELLNEWNEPYVAPAPAQEDYFLDLDYRLSMIELGL